MESSSISYQTTTLKLYEEKLQLENNYSSLNDQSILSINQPRISEAAAVQPEHYGIYTRDNVNRSRASNCLQNTAPYNQVFEDANRELRKLTRRKYARRPCSCSDNHKEWVKNFEVDVEAWIKERDVKLYHSRLKLIPHLKPKYWGVITAFSLTLIKKISGCLGENIRKILLTNPHFQDSQETSSFHCLVEKVVIELIQRFPFLRIIEYKNDTGIEFWFNGTCGKLDNYFKYRNTERFKNRSKKRREESPALRPINVNIHDSEVYQQILREFIKIYNEEKQIGIGGRIKQFLNDPILPDYFYTVCKNGTILHKLHTTGDLQPLVMIELLCSDMMGLRSVQTETGIGEITQSMLSHPHRIESEKSIKYFQNAPTNEKSQLTCIVHVGMSYYLRIQGNFLECSDLASAVDLYCKSHIFFNRQVPLGLENLLDFLINGILGINTPSQRTRMLLFEFQKHASASNVKNEWCDYSALDGRIDYDFLPVTSV